MSETRIDHKASVLAILEEAGKPDRIKIELAVEAAKVHAIMHLAERIDAASAALQDQLALTDR